MSSELSISLHGYARYPEVRDCAHNGKTFLNLFCYVSQHICKLIHGGMPSDSLVGVGSELKFIDLEYKLFGDRETLKARFYTEDFLAEFSGKNDIIFLGLVFALDQLR